MEQAAQDEELIRFWSSSKKKRAWTFGFNGLRDWLVKMAPQVEHLRNQHEKLEMDMKRKVDELKAETGLVDIDFNLSWTLTHCRGCLQLFKKALSTSGVPIMNLKGWVSHFCLNLWVFALL